MKKKVDGEWGVVELTQDIPPCRRCGTKYPIGLCSWCGRYSIVTITCESCGKMATGMNGVGFSGAACERVLCEWEANWC